MSDEGIELVIHRLEQVLGKKIVSHRSAKGGYTSAHRLIVQCSDGSSFFAKAATDFITSEWLRQEHMVYERLTGPFMAKAIAWIDSQQGSDADDAMNAPLLVLEDLSAGHWNVEWNSDSIKRVLDMLKLVHASPCPGELPTLESTRSDLVSWHLVSKEPERFLKLGLCSADWLTSALPRLLEAENASVLSGSSIVHLDVRSDNLCFMQDRVVLVDWNWACIGNPKVDIVAWLPSLNCEGGPLPEDVLVGEPELVSLFAGFWAYRAGLPPLSPDNGVRKIQLEQLKVALPWCARVLGLPTLDGNAT